MDGRVLGFALLLGVFTGVLFGLAPALQATGNRVRAILALSGPTLTARRRTLRSTLVVSEIALALVLLTGAGLMLKSFMRMRAVDPGFRTENVLTMTVDWTRDRYSFGRPLASYQAIKHRLADMTMWFHACRGITARAVDRVAARATDATLWVSAAKSYIGEHAGPIVQDCIQLHGGIGVTWEHDLHLFLRRIALYRNLFGTPSEHHRAIYRSTRSSGPAA